MDIRNNITGEEIRKFSGTAIVPTDNEMKYPRMCAHRGFSAIAPENSMPAFGAAIALGAEEIEFDLWSTKDGEIVSCHDDKLDRVSDGTGLIYEHTYEELKQYDFGVKFGPKFKGLRIVLFEEILRKFAGHVIMNVHVKTIIDEYDDGVMQKIVSLIRKYDCVDHVYFMISHDGVIQRFKEFAPDIHMCVGYDEFQPWDIVDRAIKFGAEKVQLNKPFFNQEMIDKAHHHRIMCNVFWSDDPKEAKSFLEMGIDTILTNNYNLVSQILKQE